MSEEVALAKAKAAERAGARELEIQLANASSASGSSGTSIVLDMGYTSWDMPGRWGVPWAGGWVA